MVSDKDSRKVLSMLPKTANYYFCQPNIPRAKAASAIAQEANSAGLIGKTFNTVQEAYQAALKQAAPNDLIFIGGSTFVVAEVV
jgi:dihydrofolate synthase/folylpolyglutamate synthase